MITQIIPKLPFIDKEKTVAFYTEIIGFTMVQDYGDYFILKIDEQEIHFFSYTTLAPHESDFMIYLRLTDIENFYKTLQEKGTKIHPNGALETKPWQMLEFSMTDPNGTLLSFGEPKN